MEQLESWQNAQRLRAAEGWLELGLVEEAWAELAQLGPELRQGAPGLEIQWLLFAERGHWDAAFAVAQQTIDLHPSNEAGWIHRSYAARRRPGGGLTLAQELLQPAIHECPRSRIVPFNLACYAAQLGDLTGAWAWLERSATNSNWRETCILGLKDADLKPLWPRLREKQKPQAGPG